jgi:3-deoxy-D-manno-octulosonic-acid transferase
VDGSLRALFVMATYLYSVGIWLIAIPAAKVAGLFSRRLRYQLQGRRLKDSVLAAIAHKLDPSRPTAIYLCSSAGEYEQGMPVIEAMEASARYNSVICFVSKSGVRFAESRGEHRPYFLAPVDTIWEWKRVQKYLNPSALFVVRYEVWPAFAVVFSRLRRLVLLDASRSIRAQTDFYYRWTMRCFTHIFCVSEPDLRHFQESIGTKACVALTGDTKYDRVLQRSEMHSEKFASLRTTLAPLTDGRFVMLIGSAWEADMLLLGPAFARLRELSDRNPLLIVVPHDIGPNNIRKIRHPLDHEKLSTVLWKDYIHAPRIRSTSGDQINCLIVNELGILFELYRISHAAMVGGASHHKVHNVLEPATFNLPICFGPYYTTQKEAVQMVDRGFATVVKDHHALATWMLSVARGESLTRSTRQFVESLAGATKQIVELLQSEGSRSR